MKLFSGLALGGLGLAGTLMLAMQGCSSTTDTDPAVDLKKPPTAEGAATGASDSKFYAIRTLSLGDADRSGVPSANAWKKYGYDIDSLASTDKSTNHCKLKPGAAPKTRLDGEGGTDNSFGQIILPIITTASADAPKQINDSLTKGEFTILIEVKGFSDAADQTNTGLTGQLFAGAKRDTAPLWDGSDEWKVSPGLLADGNTIAGGSKVKFNDAYVNKGTFVSGKDAKVTLSLAIGGSSLDLSINRATITMKKPAAGTTAATDGVISGVLKTSELITELRKVAGRISTTLCSGSAFDQIASQIEQASDINSDGTNSSSGECDGISIGIGFTATAVKAPVGVQPSVGLSQDPCVDQGTDAGTDSSTSSDAGKD